MRVKRPTFAPLKIRKRGASKVVVRPDGQARASGRITRRIDQPLLVALTRALYWQPLLDDDAVGSGSEAVMRHFVLNLIRVAPSRRKGGLKVQRLVASTSGNDHAEVLGLVQDSCACPALPTGTVGCLP